MEESEKGFNLYENQIKDKKGDPIRQKSCNLESSDLEEKREGHERGGKKDIEELEKALLSDFRGVLSENSPLKKEFSPQEEIRKIRKLPRQERKEAFSVFKNKLERQREGWANCRVFLERIIEFDNDIPKDYLLKWVYLFGENYGFTEKHYNLTEKIIDAFYKERKRCLDFLSTYRDNLHEAANKITGEKFNKKQEVGVSSGKASVNITVNEEDYEKIIKKMGDGSLQGSCGFFGFFSTDLFTGLGYTVIKRGYEEESIRVHEEEHAKNRLLFRYLHENDACFEKRILLEGALCQEKDEKVIEDIFKQYVKTYQEEALLRAKNEIIAYKKDGSVNNFSEAIFSIDSETSYDYLKDIRASFEGGEKAEIANNILVDEYLDIIESAILSFEELEIQGYTTDQVIALFSDKKLEEWRKTAKRIIEQKEKTS